jgi:hypothetical protein
MKKFCAMLLAIAAVTSLQAYAQDGEKMVDPKACQARCKDMMTVETMSKDPNFAAVQNDPAKSDAEKAKLHKDAAKKVCRKICTDE